MSTGGGSSGEDGFKVKVGPPWITKYEKARIIGIRALQIALGAPVLIPLEEVESLDPVVIAQRELENMLLPILVVRWTPDGRVQEIPIKRLAWSPG